MKRVLTPRLQSPDPAHTAPLRASARELVDVVAPGHDTAEIETVVLATADHAVVEKRDEAGEVAEATDPRA